MNSILWKERLMTLEVNIETYKEMTQQFGDQELCLTVRIG
jgi:hypothetical protein